MTSNKVTFTIIIILAALVIGFASYEINKYLSEKTEVREIGIFNNGTMYGQVQMINYIQTNQVIPLITPEGNITQLSWPQFCQRLEVSNG